LCEKYIYNIPFSHNTFVTDDDDRRTDRQMTHRAIDALQRSCSALKNDVGS